MVGVSNGTGMRGSMPGGPNPAVSAAAAPSPAVPSPAVPSPAAPSPDAPSPPPEILDCPAAWHGAGMADSKAWQWELDAEAVAEIETALEDLRRQDTPWREVTRARFPLPRTATLMAAVAEELENGLGLVRLGGLPVERHPPEMLRRLLFGMASHIGTPVYQNARGELMGEIADEGANVGETRGQMRDEKTGEVFLSSRSRAQSTAPLRWHTDRCDVVGLLCARQAKRGGESLLASAVTVNNEMTRRRPDLAALLYGDIPRSRLGEERGGEHCYYPLPVFSVHEGKFSTHYSRTFVEAVSKLPDAPPITDAQWEALDLLAEIAQEVSFAMTLRPGDLQFLNNHVVYHARNSFEDHDDPDLKRRLYRVWLSAPNSRALPDRFSVLWGRTEAGALRGGMCQGGFTERGIAWSSPEAGERTGAWFLG